MTLLGKTVYVFHQNKIQSGLVLSVHIGLGSANGQRTHRQAMLDKLPTVTEWFKTCAAIGVVKIKLENNAHITAPISRVYLTEDAVPEIESNTYMYDAELADLISEHNETGPYAIGQFVYILKEIRNTSWQNHDHPMDALYENNLPFRVPSVCELNVKPVKCTVVGYYSLKTKDTEENQLFLLSDDGIVQGLKLPKPVYTTIEDARAGLKSFQEAFNTSSQAMRKVLEANGL